MSGRFFILTGDMGEPGTAWDRLGRLTLSTKAAYSEMWGDGVSTLKGAASWDRLLHESDPSSTETGKRVWNHIGFARTRYVQTIMNVLVETDRRLRSDNLKIPNDWIDETSIEFILWMDADAAITNPNVDLCAYLNGVSPTALFYAADDHNGLQSGVFAFRVCPESLEILERVWRADKKHDTGCWWEQGALAEATTEPGVRAVCEKWFFDAYPEGWEGADWRPDSFIIHAANASDERRYEAIERALAIAEEYRTLKLA